LLTARRKIVVVTRRPPDDDSDTLADGKRTKLGVGPGVPYKDEIDLVGSIVGTYLVESKIGRGAMGTVYRAKDLDTNRVVALKALHEHHLNEPRAVERFRREARLAARLGHPHVVGVFELIQTADGRFAIAFELVEGEPLTEIITMPLAPERAMTLAAQLLRGLEHAHAVGLVHRDLKPDNVLVEWRNARDHARIVDFGIAIAHEGSAESLDRLTATGQVVGTIGYMSPEQALGDVVDERADLYSLGLILYEMLAGVPPYEGKAIDVLGKKLRSDPPLFADRVPSIIVEPMLELYCRKLLQRQPEHRFQTAREALNVLKLIETDPRSAAPFLGIMDVEKAIAVVSLPPPPKRR
jgi:serine/threonine-protein kinase